jgi:hypothetical protein
VAWLAIHSFDLSHSFARDARDQSDHGYRRKQSDSLDHRA